MLILLTTACSQEERAALLDRIQGAGCRVTATPSSHGEVLIAEGDLDHLKRIPLGILPGVRKVVGLSEPYALSGREHQPEPTVVRVGSARIGGGGFTVIGGPCAVESREQLWAAADAVKTAGADMLRGGAYKPRTSPYSFRGLGTEGLMLLREAGQAFDLPVVSELCDPRHVEVMVTNVDMLQIGTRNMSNFDLLIEVGKSGHPVLLKRGRSATVKDWLLAAEYILSQGNPNVVLCERGVRGFDPATRNLLDLAAVVVAQARSHLPVIVDPSHATGHARFVAPLAKAACAVGADGTLIEVHCRPEEAQSDAEQALRPAEFRDLCEDLRLLEKVRGKGVNSADA